MKFKMPAYAQTTACFEMGEIEFEAKDLVEAQEVYEQKCKELLQEKLKLGLMPSGISTDGWSIDNPWNLTDFHRSVVKE
jgi:hypothetical protein